MSTIDDIRYLLQEKKKSNLNTEEDIQKIDVLETFLINDRCFIHVNRLVAYEILNFLGVSEEKIDDVYDDLIAYENIKGEFEIVHSDEGYIIK